MTLNSWFAVSTGQDLMAPFRTAATTAQGPPPTTTNAWVGVLMHSVLAVGFGIVFAAVLAPLRRRLAGWLAWAGLVFGAPLYLVDFQILPRTVPRFAAFLQVTNQPFELAAHLVFGAVLAALLLFAKPSR